MTKKQSFDPTIEVTVTMERLFSANHFLSKVDIFLPNFL